MMSLLISSLNWVGKARVRPTVQNNVFISFRFDNYAELDFMRPSSFYQLRLVCLINIKVEAV